MAMGESGTVQIPAGFFLDEPRAQDRALRSLVNARSRVCVECGAFLSRYNHSDKYCALHEPPKFRTPTRW